jgi:hypothetical protein
LVFKVQAEICLESSFQDFELRNTLLEVFIGKLGLIEPKDSKELKSLRRQRDPTGVKGLKAKLNDHHLYQTRLMLTYGDSYP